MNLVHNYFLHRMRCSRKKNRENLFLRKVLAPFEAFDETTEIAHAYIEVTTGSTQIKNINFFVGNLVQMNSVYDYFSRGTRCS